MIKTMEKSPWKFHGWGLVVINIFTCELLTAALIGYQKKETLVKIEDIVNTYIGGTSVTGAKQLEILHPPIPHVHLHRFAIEGRFAQNWLRD